MTARLHLECGAHVSSNQLIHLTISPVADGSRLRKGEGLEMIHMFKQCFGVHSHVIVMCSDAALS